MKHSYHNNSSGHPILAFLAGAATVTALGGYFLYGPKGPENREKLSRWMLRAKREILTKMETIEDLTEDKYHTIVDEVTSRFGQMKHIGDEKATEVAQSFKEKWEDMRDMVAQAREDAENEIAEEERKEKAPNSQSPTSLR